MPKRAIGVIAVPASKQGCLAFSAIILRPQDAHSADKLERIVKSKSAQQYRALFTYKYHPHPHKRYFFPPTHLLTVVSKWVGGRVVMSNLGMCLVYDPNDIVDRHFVDEYIVDRQRGTNDAGVDIF